MLRPPFDMTAPIDARYQHERLDLRHEHGGQAKFLETAMVDEADNALEIIATHLRRAL